MSRMKLTVIGLYNFNESLFDGLQLPEGVDRERLIFTLLEQAGDFGLLYPDWDFMKMAITVWSANEMPIWEKLYETTQLEYDPIENYDRREEINRKTQTAGNGTTINSGTAFNELTPREENRSVSNASDSGTEDIISRVHGNIGVTTSQQMIQAQREVVQFNIYNHIAASFISRFCIQIY